MGGLLNLFQTDPVAFFALAAALVMALSFHEFAHAYSADKFGDPTPRSQGRVTLNPIAHLDPFGTLLLLVAGFGYAKPVMVNMARLTRWQNFWVAAAGPLSNILLALITAGVMLLLPIEVIGRTFGDATMLGRILRLFFSVNIVLAVFNLLPIPMLDGSRILSGLVPPLGKALERFERTPYAFVIVMVFILAFQGPIGDFIGIVQEASMSLILSLKGG